MGKERIVLLRTDKRVKCSLIVKHESLPGKAINQKKKKKKESNIELKNK